MPTRSRTAAASALFQGISFTYRARTGAVDRCSNSGRPRGMEDLGASQPLECGQGFPMLRLGLLQYLREPSGLAQRLQPRITDHRRIAEEPTRDHAFEQLERQCRLAEVSQVPRQVE